MRSLGEAKGDNSPYPTAAAARATIQSLTIHCSYRRRQRDTWRLKRPVTSFDIVIGVAGRL